MCFSAGGTCRLLSEHPDLRPWLKCQRVRAREVGRLALRIERAHRNNPVGCGVLLAVQHRAVMLAMATAAGWKASVGALRECEHGRNHGKHEGREQQDGEQASHEIPDAFSVRPLSLSRSRVFVLRRFHQLMSSSGLSWV